jgi:hypothetical protein
MDLLDFDKRSDAVKGTVKEHQRDATLSGRKFQNEIYSLISNGLRGNERVSVEQPYSKIIITAPGKVSKTKRFYCLEIHTAAGSIIGDTDIVIFNKRRAIPICIVSCKTSLHSRDTESLYYARLYRDQYAKGLPFFFVTKDINKNRSELGSIDKPTKPRILFQFENISVYSTNPKTQFGGCIKPISQLVPDLLKMC